MAAKIKFTKQLKRDFVEKYIENDLHIGLTCDDIGICYNTFSRARKTDLNFADEIENAKNGLDNILFNYIMDGLKDQDTRLAYLKLMSAQRIDKIMSTNSSKDESDIIFKLKKSDLID